MNSKLKALLVLIAALLLGCIYGLVSQTREGDTVDKIVAVVGKEIITQSDINAYITAYIQQDPSIKSDDTTLRRKVLDQMINEKLVVTKAEEDSISVTDDEINQRWDYHLSNLVRYYGSEKRIEDIYKTSIARIKNDYIDDIRKQLLAEKLRAKEFGEVKATPKDIEDFYRDFKDSIPKIPMEIELYHIVRNVDVGRNKKEKVYELSLKVRDSLVAGGNFADFAKRYSDDAATASSGGDLGWFEKGKLFQEFEQAAFALKIGEISMPVETPFGYHIIQTMNKNRDSVLTRHILFKIGTGDKENEEAKKFLSDLKEKIIKGESFDSLARINSDEKETQGFGGYLGKLQMKMVPENMKDVIDKLKDGGISDPLPYTPEPKPSFHIIWKKRVIPEHTANLNDDFKEVEQLATTYKQNKQYSDWILDLRKTIYWEIKK